MKSRAEGFVASAHSARKCPACSGDGKPVGYKEGISVLACRRCKSLYSADSPQPSARWDYDAIYTTEETTVIPDFINDQVTRIVSGFVPFRQSNHLLDLGFGSAAFMRAAAKDGWEISGVEVSYSAIEHARQLGFQNIFRGDLTAAGYASGRFDVVVASEVLEHVSDPRLLLAEVARVLRPGGLLWASTPHACGLSFRLLRLDWSVVSPLEHLQLFSRAGMKTLLTMIGFSEVHLATHGFNPYEVLHARRLRSRRHTHVHHELTAFDRVATSRSLNEKLMRTPIRRTCKQLINATLSASKLGDRLKIWAIR
jgi:2-polyprenyl-3-methyl-5-hydroxy-6-metoxy-1,4-benzoquinol methylase